MGDILVGRDVNHASYVDDLVARHSHTGELFHDGVWHIVRFGEGAMFLIVNTRAPGDEVSRTNGERFELDVDLLALETGHVFNLRSYAKNIATTCDVIRRECHTL